MSGLEVRIGIHSERGLRPDNQDFVAAYLGDRRSRQRHGVIAVVADGVAGARGGRVASELTVRGVIEGFLAARPTLGIRQALAPVIEALNDWIWAVGRRDRDLAGMATTLSVLVLRDRTASVLHVGDSRVYRLRDGVLTQLTTDHVPDRADSKHLLLRAIGLESGVRIDCGAYPLRMRDRFVLCSDGLHGALSQWMIRDLLQGGMAPEQMARHLAAAALDAGGSDNVSVAVLDVLGLAAADIDALVGQVAALPVLAPPVVGDIVDGFRLTALLSDGRYGRVFRAEDMQAAGAACVLKFPKPHLNDNPAFRAAFAHELWVSGQIRSHLLGEVLALPPERQTRLYIPTPFYGGESLEARLLRLPRIGLREGVAIGQALAKAAASLHGAGIIHRDIKPENVILTGPASLRLIDLGIASLPGRMLHDPGETAGTASYRAPEQFGEPGNVAPASETSDIYALGVTIYRLFTGQFPYGEIEPFSHPRFGKPAPLSRHRPDLPLWLELLLERCVATDPRDRPPTALALALALETGLAEQLATASPLRKRPFIDRHPVLFWQLCSAALLVVILALIMRR